MLHPAKPWCAPEPHGQHGGAAQPEGRRGKQKPLDKKLASQRAAGPGTHQGAQGQVQDPCVKAGGLQGETRNQYTRGLQGNSNTAFREKQWLAGIRMTHNDAKRGQGKEAELTAQSGAGAGHWPGQRSSGTAAQQGADPRNQC